MVSRSISSSAASGPAAAAIGPAPHVLIIESRYYEHIAQLLLDGALQELTAHGASWDRVLVPGALEIPQALALAVSRGYFADSAAQSRCAGVIALGCVIRGETSHYDTVCNNANHWLMEIATRHAIPLGNAILTVENEAQAMARAVGGRAGKGGDAARACLKLIEIARAFEGQNV